MCLENRNLLWNYMKEIEILSKICPEKSNFLFVKLPEKIEIFLENRNFLTRAHDPPDFKPDWRRWTAWGTPGTVPQNLKWGDGPCIRPPSNILRNNVIRSVAKYELTKKRCQGGNFCSEIDVFRQEKGLRPICYILETDRKKTDKKWSMTKKKIIRNFQR